MQQSKVDRNQAYLYLLALVHFEECKDVFSSVYFSSIILQEGIKFAVILNGYTL